MSDDIKIRKRVQLVQAGTLILGLMGVLGVVAFFNPSILGVAPEHHEAAQKNLVLFVAAAFVLNLLIRVIAGRYMRRLK
jgi:hypothetical protein